MPVNGTPVIKEVSSLTSCDCFTIFSCRERAGSPLHFHGEYELNLLLHAKGAKHVIGDKTETIANHYLVLLGPNLIHSWTPSACKNEETIEIIIQWKEDLFDDKFLQRNQMSYLKNMFDRSLQGLSFSEETILQLSSRILGLNEKCGFDALEEFLGILHVLSLSSNSRTILISPTVPDLNLRCCNNRIRSAFLYLNERFQQPISLLDVARIANMTEVGFSRFIRKRTGHTFTENLTNIRVNHAIKMLAETSHSIAEISRACGFRNLSNFNRIFKRKENCTPQEYRRYFQAGRRSIAFTTF